MRRSLPIFLSIVLIMIAIVGMLGSGGIKDNPKVASAAGPETNSNIYTVKEGDSLYLIAQRFSTTVNALKENNGLKSHVIYPGQKLTISLPQVREGLDKSSSINQSATDEIRIVIIKSHQKLAIYRGDTELKIYRAEFGEGGMEDKEVQGDRKTPEGTFYITEKSILTPADEYLGTRWMRLSYPNIEDAQRGLEQGIIDRETHDSIVWAINNGKTPPQRTALGGGIGIHGGDISEFGGNWTWGCVGLTNEDVEEIYDYVSVGTPVIITR